MDVLYVTPRERAIKAINCSKQPWCTEHQNQIVRVADAIASAVEAAATGTDKPIQPTSRREWYQNGYDDGARESLDRVAAIERERAEALRFLDQENKRADENYRRWGHSQIALATAETRIATLETELDQSNSAINYAHFLVDEASYTDDRQAMYVDPARVHELRDALAALAKDAAPAATTQCPRCHGRGFEFATSVHCNDCKGKGTTGAAPAQSATPLMAELNAASRAVDAWPQRDKDLRDLSIRAEEHFAQPTTVTKCECGHDRLRHCVGEGGHVLTGECTFATCDCKTFAAPPSPAATKEGDE